MENWNHIVSPCSEGTRIRIKVSPGASKTRIIGPHDRWLKVAVNAPPEKGKANQALINILAKKMNVHKKTIQLLSGQTAQIKVLLISGKTPQQCLDLLK